MGCTLRRVLMLGCTSPCTNLPSTTSLCILSRTCHPSTGGTHCTSLRGWERPGGARAEEPAADAGSPWQPRVLQVPDELIYLFGDRHHTHPTSPKRGGCPKRDPPFFILSAFILVHLQFLIQANTHTSTPLSVLGRDLCSAVSCGTRSSGKMHASLYTGSPS